MLPEGFALEYTVAVNRWDEHCRSLKLHSDEFTVDVMQSIRLDNGKPEPVAVNWPSVGARPPEMAYEFGALLCKAAEVAATIERCETWERFDASLWYPGKEDKYPIFVFVTPAGIELIPQDDEIIVHVLRHGMTLCGSGGLIQEEGHQWASPKEFSIPGWLPENSKRRWCRLCDREFDFHFPGKKVANG